MSDFGGKIRKIRTDKKLSLKDVAKLGNLSHPYISQIENNKRNTPKPEIIKKLAKGLGVPYNKLLKEAGYIDTSDVDLEMQEWFYSNLDEVLNELTINDDFSDVINDDIKQLEKDYDNLLEVDEKITPKWIRDQISNSTYRSEWVLNLIGDLRKISKKHNLHLDLNIFLSKDNITYKGKSISIKQNKLINSYIEALFSD
ncbi:helix-turn-helix domain-containing protein [Paraliobacillus sediminis]|uniref:helix-turn-helix domain-containing protein n=1 Tax=Paraliobacillus sediminis TaxID=1885916 RepID=UPI0013C2D7C3|nr:helix-turn-helix transcriptional regulator [Paraliobacillus sediminis]